MYKVVEIHPYTLPHSNPNVVGAEVWEKLGRIIQGTCENYRIGNIYFCLSK